MAQRPSKEEEPNGLQTIDVAGHKLPFRPRISREERQQQVLRSSNVLEHLRATHQDQWPQLSDERLPVGTGIRELKEMVKRTLHQCSESRDFMHTPDFVTKRAIAKILAERRGKHNKVRRGALNRKILCHEHMVPGDEMLRRIINLDGEPPQSPTGCLPAPTHILPRGLLVILNGLDPDTPLDHTTRESLRALLSPREPALTPVAPLLRRLPFTALVARNKQDEKDSEEFKLDAKHLKCAVPDAANVFTNATQLPPRVPHSFLGLLRYEPAGITCDELHPLNTRAKVVLRKYKKWRKRWSASIPAAQPEALESA